METSSNHEIDLQTAASLIRKWEGSATDSDNQAIADWMAMSPNHAELHDVLLEAWEAPAKILHVADTQNFRNRVRVAIAGSAEKKKGVEYFGVSLPRWTSLWVVPVFCVLVVGVFSINHSHTHPTPDTRTYATAPAQRANLTLEDGSRVVLAPATTMRVSGRNIELNGEAVFTVTNHTGNPFIVKSGNTITRVLGTTFAIRAYTDQVRIAVSEGKISISNASSPEGAAVRKSHSGASAQLWDDQPVHTLTAGDIAEISPRGTQISSNTDISAMLSWTEGKLTLTGLTLAQAIPDLNRWYDADIQIKDSSLSGVQFEGSFGTGSRSDLASSLEFILGARVEQHGRVLTVRKP